jgi:hypothetical protein
MEILLPFGYSIPRFGILHLEKSGNPDHTAKKIDCFQGGSQFYESVSAILIFADKKA